MESLNDTLSNKLPVHESSPQDSITTHRTEDIVAFVNELAREFLLDGPDRRAEPRYRITVPVVVKPVDEDFKPLGTVIRAVTRDVSCKGIGLICQDPLHSNVLVELSSPLGRQLRAIAHVLRSEPIGYYFDVGCVFITR